MAESIHGHHATGSDIGPKFESYTCIPPFNFESKPHGAQLGLVGGQIGSSFCSEGSLDEKFRIACP